jgi:hypothetical protein
MRACRKRLTTGFACDCLNNFSDFAYYSAAFDVSSIEVSERVALHTVLIDRANGKRSLYDVRANTANRSQMAEG